jgi:hypothetical protein
MFSLLVRRFFEGELHGLEMAIRAPSSRIDKGPLLANSDKTLTLGEVFSDSPSI